VVIFDFQPGRGREGPKQFLGHFNGILQTDGYSGYDRVGGPKLIHAGCGAHARRYFFQAVEAHPDDRAAIALVATIDELFAIDAQPRERNLMVTERDRLRQQRAGQDRSWNRSRAKSKPLAARLCQRVLWPKPATTP
jgi:hypothetical protein